MRDHNYQSRMKNCYMRFILTVDNEKALCEKRKSPFEIIDYFFSEPVSHNQSAECILAGAPTRVLVRWPTVKMVQQSEQQLSHLLEEVRVLMEQINRM